VKYAAIYAVGRLAVLAAALGVLYLVGLRSFYLVLAALALSLPISYFVLRGPRDAMASRFEQHLRQRREENHQLREALAGDEPAEEALAEDEPAGDDSDRSHS
jgi:hypothetical protein